MIEITTSNSTKVNELLFAFGNLRSEVTLITMTTPTLTPFHQKNSRESASRERGIVPPFSLNPLTPRRPTAAFTLIELLAVITVIGILAGLTLGAAGAVRRHGASSTAKAEVAALQAACDRYFADNNLYPTTNSMPDPSSSYSPTASIYTGAGQALFTNLLGSVTLSVAPTTKRYFEPKPAMVYTNGSPNYLIDPWGYAYGYNSDGTNAPLIWSTAGTTKGETNKWIASWPKM
jgi:prepilin-type N-terminal cleavage/methylation domain-containing protein